MQRKENRRGGKGRGSGMSFTEGRISLVVQWLRIRFPMQGKRVPPMVEELRSHIAVEQLRLHVAIIEPETMIHNQRSPHVAKKTLHSQSKKIIIIIKEEGGQKGPLWERSIWAKIWRRWGRSYEGGWEKSGPGRGNKGPVAGACLVSSRNKEACVTGVQWVSW